MRAEPHTERQRLLDVVPLKQPFVLIIDPCGVCNFKCSFCPCNISTVNREQRHVIMNMELFEKIVHDIRAFPEKIKAIDLYGFGEPLLNKNLPEMIKMLKGANVCDKIRLSTNGALLNEDMSRSLCEAGLDYMKVSIEALDDEGYRKICGTDVKYYDIVNNIRNFYEKWGGQGTEIGIKIISSAIKSEADKQRFLETFTPVSDYIFIETVKSIWAEFEEIDIPQTERKEDDYYTEHIRGYDICSYPLTNMMVHSNGDIGLCCLDWKHATSYANVKETSLLEAWNSKELREFRIKHLQRRRNEVPFCNKCLQKGYDNVDADAEELIKKL